MHVCDICEEIIGVLTRPEIKSSSPERGFINIKAVNFGWLDSIIENNDECSLCRLVTKIWYRVCYEEDGRNDDPSRRIYVYLDNATPTSLAKNGTRLYWTTGIDFFYPGRNGEPPQPVKQRWQPKFSLLADDFSKVELIEWEQPFLLGRVRRWELPYDADFLKTCFETCLTEHGQFCQTPIREYTGRSFPLNNGEALPLRMRCIDVVGQNIVHIPRDGSCRYAVLSYVWGNSNYLRLTKANYAQYTAREGLKHVQKPRTIAHAIEVTAALNLRYLWVDSLCIIQDYDSEKSQQMQKMNTIYAGAALTIVAAGTDEADGGLWNTIEGSRQTQVEEEVAGLRFIGTEPTLEDVLRDSTWKTRAWTYQEYVLSKRLLVFSDTQAYFSCEKGACAEDYVHSITDSGIHRLHHLPSDDDFGVSVNRLLNFPIFWPTLIREYTKRELTFEADALNAAAGVMAAYSIGSADSFICGLPLSGLFEYSMLWYPSGTLRRRSLIDGGESFPTWSWVGWVGPVSYEDTDESLNIESGRIIQEWSLKSSQKTLHFDHGELSISYKGIEQGMKADYPKRTVLNHKSDKDRHISSIGSCILSFRTSYAQLRIAPTFSHQFVMSEDEHCDHTGLYKVFDKDTWIGSVHLEHQTAKDLSAEDSISHEFIALSVGSGGNSWYVPERKDPRNSDAESDWTPLFDQALLERHNDDDEVYRVMLVNYQDSGAVAKRLGIGQIHRKSFEEAKRGLKHIMLG